MTDPRTLTESDTITGSPAVAPAKLTGKEFEREILEAAAKLADRGILTLGRYGTQANYMNDPATGQAKVQPIQSLPDFDGVLAPDGLSLCVEAKVCGKASLELTEGGKKVKTRQLRHLIERSRFGASCWLLVFFCERRLVRSHSPSLTVAIPVVDSPRWQSALAHDLDAIPRDDLTRWGAVPVPWGVPAGSRKPRPDLLSIPWREGATLAAAREVAVSPAF